MTTTRTPMRFGIFDHVERQPGIDLATQFEERLRFVELAEEAGFYAYHVAEHHHATLCLAPSQAVFLAAVAQRTKRLRLGPLVHVLPMYHPVRLIEEICMVDQISDGRYQVGVGPGTGGAAEFTLWGGDPEENYERFEETLEILRKGLQCEYLTHEGRFYRFQNLWMELRPKQQPHAPLWWGGRAESAARRAANWVGGPSIEALSEAVPVYRAALDEVVRDPGPYIVSPADPLYGGKVRLFIADTDEEARERGLSAYRSFCDHFEDARQYVRPAIREKLPQLAPAERALETGAILAGSPETVRGYALRYREVGANYFVCEFQWGDLTHEEAVNTLSLFTQEVMPVFA